MIEQRKKVSIIAPFYNEGEGVDYFYEVNYDQMKLGM